MKSATLPVDKSAIRNPKSEMGGPYLSNPCAMVPSNQHPISSIWHSKSSPQFPLTFWGVKYKQQSAVFPNQIPSLNPVWERGLEMVLNRPKTPLFRIDGERGFVFYHSGKSGWWRHYIPYPWMRPFSLDSPVSLTAGRPHPQRFQNHKIINDIFSKTLFPSDQICQTRVLLSIMRTQPSKDVGCGIQGINRQFR